MSSKLREAVESLLDLLDDFAVTEEIVSIAHENQCHRESLHTDKTLAVLQKAKAALAEPPRNCDVGTASDMAQRFMLFCQEHRNLYKCCDGCPLLHRGGPCEFEWAQMTYEKGKTK